MKLEKIHTDKNPSDMMTKVVSKGKLELCLELVGRLREEINHTQEHGRFMWPSGSRPSGFMVMGIMVIVPGLSY